jgi:hypothetical protein
MLRAGLQPQAGPHPHACVIDSGRCGAKGRCDTPAHVADINKRGLCGSRDWRLPTAQELEGLLQPEAPGAKIDAFLSQYPGRQFLDQRLCAHRGRRRDAGELRVVDVPAAHQRQRRLRAASERPRQTLIAFPRRESLPEVKHQESEQCNRAALEIG